MTSVITAALYLLYIAAACFICTRCYRWWRKILVSTAALGGLQLLEPLAAALVSLLTSLLSLAFTVGIYIILFAVFIRCLIPRRRF